MGLQGLGPGLQGQGQAVVLQSGAGQAQAAVGVVVGAQAAAQHQAGVVEAGAQVHGPAAVAQVVLVAQASPPAVEPTAVGAVHVQAGVAHQQAGQQLELVAKTAVKAGAAPRGHRAAARRRKAAAGGRVGQGHRAGVGGHGQDSSAVAHAQPLCQGFHPALPPRGRRRGALRPLEHRGRRAGRHTGPGGRLRCQGLRHAGARQRRHVAPPERGVVGHLVHEEHVRVLRPLHVAVGPRARRVDGRGQIVGHVLRGSAAHAHPVMHLLELPAAAVGLVAGLPGAHVFAGAGRAGAGGGAVGGVVAVVAVGQVGATATQAGGVGPQEGMGGHSNVQFALVVRPAVAGPRGKRDDVHLLAVEAGQVGYAVGVVGEAGGLDELGAVAHEIKTQRDERPRHPIEGAKAGGLRAQVHLARLFKPHLSVGFGLGVGRHQHLLGALGYKLRQAVGQGIGLAQKAAEPGGPGGVVLRNAGQGFADDARDGTVHRHFAQHGRAQAQGHGQLAAGCQPGQRAPVALVANQRHFEGGCGVGGRHGEHEPAFVVGAGADAVVAHPHLGVGNGLAGFGIGHAAPQHEAGGRLGPAQAGRQ